MLAPMQRSLLGILVVTAAACGSDDRPVNIPAVPTGAFEASCQQLCTLEAGESTCSAKHAEFCVASCRARTNGLTAACGQCLIQAGDPIKGDTDGFGDRYCAVGGPAGLSACRAECDDGMGAAAAPAPSLASLCDLTCGFYMQDVDPLACSAEGSGDCRTECAATIATKGRICAQCVVEQTGASRTCFNDSCDCQPFFNSDPSFSCTQLCDALPPQAPT